MCRMVWKETDHCTIVTTQTELTRQKLNQTNKQTKTNIPSARGRGILEEAVRDMRKTNKSCLKMRVLLGVFDSPVAQNSVKLAKYRGDLR